MIASITRSVVSFETYLVPLITWDTVASETPALTATSFIVILDMALLDLTGILLPAVSKKCSFSYMVKYGNNFTKIITQPCYVNDYYRTGPTGCLVNYTDKTIKSQSFQKLNKESMETT